MVKEIKKLKQDNKIYTNQQLTNAVQNLVTLLENVNGILASHQICLDALAKKAGLIKKDEHATTNTIGG